MKNFIVVRVWEGFEFVITDQINSEKRAMAFCPSVRTRSHVSRHTRKPVYDIKPLFDEYVFVQFHTDEIKYGYINGLKGVQGVLFTGEFPSEIRPDKMMRLVDSEMELVRKHNPNSEAVIDPITRKLKVVASNGMSGEVIAYDKKKGKLWLESHVFGTNMKISVDEDLFPDLNLRLLEAFEK